MFPENTHDARLASSGYFPTTSAIEKKTYNRSQRPWTISSSSRFVNKPNKNISMRNDTECARLFQHLIGFRRGKKPFFQGDCCQGRQDGRRLQLFFVGKCQTHRDIRERMGIYNQQQTHKHMIYEYIYI